MNMTAAEALKKIKSPYTIEQMEEEDKLYELPSEFLPVSDENYSTNSNTNIGPYSDTEPEDEDYTTTTTTTTIKKTEPKQSVSKPTSKSKSIILPSSSSPLSPTQRHRIPLDVDHILECQFFGYVAVRTPQLASRIRRPAFRRPLMLTVNSLQTGPLMVNDNHEPMVENGPPELLVLRNNHEYTNLTVTTDLINRCKGQIVYDYVGQCMLAKEEDNKSFIVSALNHSIRHPGREFIIYMENIIKAMLDVYQPLRDDLVDLRRGDGFLDNAIFREFTEQFDKDYAAMRLDEELDDLPRKIEHIIAQKLPKRKKPFWRPKKTTTETINPAVPVNTTIASISNVGIPPLGNEPVEIETIINNSKQSIINSNSSLIPNNYNKTKFIRKSSSSIPIVASTLQDNDTTEDETESE